MATRGIIAVKRSTGFRGRYVHWDNNPERMVEVLGNIARRDGLTKMVSTLINDNASWSVIDDQKTTGDDILGYSKDCIIDGYGVIHDDMNPFDAESWFTEKDTDFAWAEYIYVISGEGLEVLHFENNLPVRMAFHEWDTIGLIFDTPLR